MNICILNVLHEPFDKRVFHKEARSLVKAGHRVTSIAPHRGPLEDEHGVAFRCIRPAHSLPDRFLSVFRLVRAGRKVAADAYFAVEPESWVAALLLKMLTGRKVVFDVHEPIPGEFAKFFPRPMQPCMRWLTVRFMRLFARFTDEIVLTRASLDNEFAGLHVRRTVVSNTNHLQPACSDIGPTLREAYGDRPTLIHQGQFGELRGSYELLEAMKVLAARLPGARCILLGPYVQGSEAEYRRAIAEAGLEEHIHLLGTVPFEEVPRYIAIADIGLILFQPSAASHALGMPHKMFDYMREGVPFIAPDFVVEVARIVRETECGVLVDVSRPESIAEAALRLFEQPEEARRLGHNGRRAVEERYNWSHDERRLLEVFERVAP